MKKNTCKLLKLFKILTLIFGISIFLWNCEKQQLLVEQISSIKNVGEQTSVISFNDLPNNILSTINDINPNIKLKQTGKTQNIALILNQDKIIKIVDSLQNSSYSINFTLEDKPKNILFNLILSSDENNIANAPYILRYTIDNLEEIKNEEGNIDFSKMKATIKRYQFNDFLSNISNSLKSKVNDNEDCLEWIFDNSDGSLDTNGGNPGGGTYTECQVNVWSSNGITYAITVTCAGVTEYYDFKGGSNCPDGTGGPVGINSSNANLPITCAKGFTLIDGKCVKENEDDKIITNDLEDKADCVYQNMVDNNNNINWILKNFKDGNEPSKFDLRFEMSTSLANGTNASFATPFQSGISNTFVIKINGNTLSDRTSLGLARTILHEGIHARLWEFYYRDGTGVTPTDFPGVYEHMRIFGKNWDHQQMAAYYRETISQGLKQYDNAQHSDSFYDALAWEGLSEIKDANNNQEMIYTQAWNKLSLAEQTAILQTITNEKQNGNKECN